MVTIHKNEMHGKVYRRWEVPALIVPYQWCNGTPPSPLGQFRSDAQKDMITAIHKNDMPGKVVLPTAGGKSLAYIVPCLCDPAPSMTIAIIPFNAVKDEAFAKAHSAGIHTVDYKPDFDGTATLLLVSAEHSITPEFETLIRKKAQEGIIRRFIIDEFHVVLIDGSWRRCTDEVECITDLDIPIFGLTGTLPLNLDTDLSRRFSVTNHNNTSVTRPAPTRGLSQNDLRTAALQKDAATCGTL
jgi:superfamily II DNA helicase RecQ